jgi:hypothetical protein
MGLTLGGPVRFVALAALLALSACGKAPNCAETIQGRVALLAAKAVEDCPEGSPSACPILSQTEIQAILGAPDDEDKSATSGGDPVWRYQEKGCENYLAVLYQHTYQGETGYIVALGRESSFTAATFPAVSELLKTW